MARGGLEGALVEANCAQVNEETIFGGKHQGSDGAMNARHVTLGGQYDHEGTLNRGINANS